jgi:dienelactone hydrolase
VSVAVRPARVPQPVFAACGYFLARLMFLPSRYAPQVQWGDVAAALDGFPCDDLDLGSSGFWREWRDRWVALAETYVQTAERSSTDAGRARAFRSAAACYHWAEFMDFDDRALKLTLRQLVRHCFQRSLQGSDLEMTSHTAHVEPDVDVPYWLILPPPQLRGPEPWPCVVLSNGLDSITEVEILALAETYIERGIAAVVFEGPGQGLSVGQVPLRLDMEIVVESIVDRLRVDERINADRLAFVGISFGGYVALRVAQRVPRPFRCVVNLSGGPRIAPFDGLPRRLKDDFRFAFMPADPAQMQKMFDELALDPAMSPATDVLSISGGLDDIFPAEDLEALNEAWGDRHELVVYGDEAHGCLNKINVVTLQAADWVASRLRSSAIAAPARHSQQQKARSTRNSEDR